MNKKSNFGKVCRILLVLLMILGILSSGMGVVVAALSRPDATEEGVAAATKPEELKGSKEFVSPTDQYTDMGEPTATFNEDVQIVSQEDAELIADALEEIEYKSYYTGEYIKLVLEAENLLPEQTQDTDTEMSYEEREAFEKKRREEITAAGEKVDQMVDRIQDAEMIFLPATEENPLGGDRIFKVSDAYFYGDSGYIELQEPYFEDVFDSMQINTSQILTKENLVGAYYADGVTSHFGNWDSEVTGVSQTDQLNNAYVSDLTANAGDDAQVVLLDRGEEDDLIVELDYKIKSKKSDNVTAELAITGSFGIRDLQAHLVCDMPTPANFEELYFGLSGTTFNSIKVTGSVEGEAEPDATDKDLKLLTLEGLNEKRFPIAIFQFVGTSPVKISNQVFKTTRENLLPNLYVMLYADWEGKITATMSSSLEYTKSFNKGLQVYKDGEQALSFVDYPYPCAYGTESTQGNVDWITTLELKAEGDLTLFGGSVLFYIAGVNVGEISVARLGMEASCDLSLTATLGEVVQVDEDVEAYLRGYLKVLEVAIKLKAEGKAFLKNFEANVEFFACPIDITLFTLGKRPQEFETKLPVSTKPQPTEFESVICLVTDASGSMDSRVSTGETKLSAAKEAGQMIATTTEQWSQKYSGNFGVGVVQFSSGAKTVTAPHVDYDYVRDCISIIHDGGGTNISGGINLGMDELDKVKSDNKVMILMTDGIDGANTEIRAAAQRAADANVTIYTIGFGDDVDEGILEEVAEMTGGEYRYASTDSIMGVIGSFIYAQQSSNAEVLTDMESTVREGELSEKQSFTVESRDGDLSITTAWPGSFLDTILVDPYGREVDEDYPNAVTDESQIPTTITVKNPVPGEWTVQVKGVETSYEEEPFYTIVAFKEVEPEPINREMDNLEQIASWCIPVGLVTALASGMLLLCMGKQKKTEE